MPWMSWNKKIGGKTIPWGRSFVGGEDFFVGWHSNWKNQSFLSIGKIWATYFVPMLLDIYYTYITPIVGVEDSEFCDMSSLLFYLDRKAHSSWPWNPLLDYQNKHVQQVCFVQRVETSQQKTTPKLTVDDSQSLSMFSMTFHEFLRDLHLNLLTVVTCTFVGSWIEPTTPRDHQLVRLPWQAWNPTMDVWPKGSCAYAEVLARRVGFFNGQMSRYTVTLQ